MFTDPNSAAKPKGFSTAKAFGMTMAQGQKIHTINRHGRGLAAGAEPPTLAAPSGRQPPQRMVIGGYQPGKEPGQGTIGVVCLGCDPETGRRAAIKTLALAREFAADELAEARQHFFNEAKTIVQLHHPHIVALYRLCSGQPPFTGASLTQRMYKIVNEPAPGIRGIEPALSPEVAAVIARRADRRRCLARLGEDAA